MSLPLDGIRVLDLTRFIGGPYCCMLLADMGAEVIRIERPGGEDDRKVGPFAPNGESMLILMYGRNKKAITLNLRTDDGKQLFRKLVNLSDILVESFAPGYMDSQDLGYNSLKIENPGLIYAGISAYGATGPYKNHGGFDAMAQALSGMMQLTGFPGESPIKSGLPVIDYGTGVYAALGILLALHSKTQTGQGQMVDTSLLDTAVSYLETVPAEYQVLGSVRPQIGNRRPFTAPTDSFQAKDGYVCVGTATDGAWRALARLIGKPELAEDTRFATNEGRARNQGYLNSVVSGWVAERTIHEVVETLREARIPVAPVQTITEMMVDPQIRAREMIVDLPHPEIGIVPMPGIPIKLSETPGQIRQPAPSVGKDNQEIYQSLLSLKPSEFQQFMADGVI